MSSARVRDWLKLDARVSSQLRVHGWEKGCTAPFVAEPGAHDAVEIAVVEAGRVSYRIGERETFVSEGQLMIVPRGVTHATSFLGEVRAFALWLGADFVAEVSDAMGPDVAKLALAPGVVGAKTARARTLLGILAEETAAAEAGHARAAEALAESVVIEILRQAPRADRRGARDGRVARAIEQMNACFAEPLGIDDLAKTAKMSRFHFSRLFRDETGEAPYQYLLRVRVAKAAELLRGGHCSVTEAALSAGFTDLSRFASTFKKHTGKRPSELLERARSA